MRWLPGLVFVLIVAAVLLLPPLRRLWLQGAKLGQRDLFASSLPALARYPL